MDAKPASANDLMIRLRLRHRPNFTATYLDPAFVAGLIAMTRPETPRSSRQQYRLTDRGRELLARKNNGNSRRKLALLGFAWVCSFPVMA
jgi:ATP-dependent DNA helicase RecG